MKLEKLIRQSGIKQLELAKLSGLTETRLSRIINQNSHPATESEDLKIRSAIRLKVESVLTDLTETQVG